MERRARPIPPAVAVLLALAVAGCGSGSGGQGAAVSAATEPPVAAPVTTGTASTQTAASPGSTTTRPPGSSQAASTAPAATCERQVVALLKQANAGTDSLGLAASASGSSIVDLVASYGPLSTENIECLPTDGTFDPPPGAERTVLTFLQAGWNIAIHLRQDPSGRWVPVGLVEIGGGQ